jgi:hypothetical protein
VASGFPLSLLITSILLESICDTTYSFEGECIGWQYRGEIQKKYGGNKVETGKKQGRNRLDIDRAMSPDKVQKPLALRAKRAEV